MEFGFVKIACASPALKVADCDYNVCNIIEEFRKSVEKGAEIIVFPELSVTGYTCGDLFFQQSLLQSAEKNLVRIIEASKSTKSLLFVGIPVGRTEGIYNCAAAILNGKLLAIIAKSYLPNYGEFYERRQFTPFEQTQNTLFIDFAGFKNIPLVQTFCLKTLIKKIL